MRHYRLGSREWRTVDSLGVSDAEFNMKDTAYFADGLRVTSLMIKDGKFAAVWRSGSRTVNSLGYVERGLCAKDRTYCAPKGCTLAR
jgi:hypothetical protein